MNSNRVTVTLVEQIESRGRHTGERAAVRGPESVLHFHSQCFFVKKKSYSYANSISHSLVSAFII